MHPWVVVGSCGMAGLAIGPWWLRLVHRHYSRGTRRCSEVALLAGLVVISMLAGWRFADDPEVMAWWWSGICGLGLAVIDLHEHRLPRGWVRALGFGVLVVFAVISVLRADLSPLWRAVTAAALVWLGMRLFEAVCAGAMGGGDTRLQAVLALQLGWVSWHIVLIGLTTGALLLGVVAGIGWLVGKRDGKSRLPAGPSLLLGCWCALFVLAP